MNMLEWFRLRPHVSGLRTEVPLPTLQLLCLDESFSNSEFIECYTYDMNKNAFRKMIDAWCKRQNLEHDSLLDELKERAAQSNIPQYHPLSNFISVLERGAKRLSNTRFESKAKLRDIGCEAKWITRRTLCECEIKEAATWNMFKGEGAREEWKINHKQTCLKETGALPIQLVMIGEHHERCVEYASEYKIPQVLTDRVSDWIQRCVQGNVDFPTIREMLVSEHDPLFQFYGTN
eukprot:g5525.t1